MKKLIIGLFVLFFVAGCAERPIYNPCCLNFSGDYKCYYGEFIFEPNDYSGFCDTEGCSAFNVTIDGRNMTFDLMPWCNPAEEDPCEKKGCYAMFCGIANYDPTEDPTQCYVMNALEDDTGKKMQGLKVSGETKTEGLYKTSCDFYEMTDSSKKSGSGIWINAFRAGVGTSYTDFEEARYYMPITDLAIKSTDGKVDRFVNYYSFYPGRQDELEGILGFGDTQTIDGMCVGTDTNSDGNDDTFTCTHEVNVLEFTTASYGSDISASKTCNEICYKIKANWYQNCTAPGGWLPPFLNNSYSYEFKDYILRSSTGQATEKVKQIDYEFYDKNLMCGYWDYTGFAGKDSLEKTLKTSWGVDFDSSICLSKDTDGNIYTDEESGWYDSEGNWHMGMPFECLSGYDCASGVCINNNHRRFSCTDKNTGKEIDCGIELDEQGKPVFETRVSIAAWWNRRGDNADLEKTLYWFATPWNAPSERIKWINEEGPRDYCGLNAWISYGCKSDEFCISYNYGDDVYRHMVQHCPFAGDAPLQVNNKKVNIFSTDEVKTYNVDINGWYRAESAYFWTNENPNNLKFIKACNMTAGEDYEIIDVKSFAADSSSNDVWMMLVSKICALGTGTYEEKYECLLSYSSGFTSYGSDYAEIRTNIYKLTASEYIPGTIFKTEEGDVYSRFAANFAKNLVKINSWGDCKTNEINGKEMIQVNDFGWCLPGTTLGFAVQEIYSSGSGGYRGLNAGVSYFPSLGDREEVGVGVCWEDWYGIKCSGGAGGSEPTKVSTFETLPDAKWFYDKTVEYQKQGIMPIILAQSDTLYEGGPNNNIWCGIKVGEDYYYAGGWDGGNCNIIASSDSVEVWRVGFSFDTQGYGAGKYMSGGRVKFTRGFGGVEAGNEYSPHRVTEEVEGQKIYGTTSKVYNLLSQFDGRGARLLDTGAMIVVVGGNKDGVGMDPGQTNEEIKARARSIKSACPKCLVAVRIYGDLNGDYECIDPDTGEVLPDQITREECQYFYSIQKLFSDWPEGGPNGEPQSLPDSEMLALIDLLVYNAGSGRPDPREVLLNVSKNTITKYNKPGIIQAWWNEEKADPRDWDFLRNQRELTDAGLIGTYRLYWRYEDYMPPYADGLSLIDSSDSKTEQFCEFQKGTLNLLSFNIQTSYSKVYATNISDCGCQMCDAIELMTGQCNPYCADGKLCEGYVGGQKCPSGGLCARIDNCTVCSNMTGDYSCLIVTSQGEIIQGPAGQLKNLTYLFPDVVGALPNDKKCCVIDPTTLNPATFKKQSRITTGSELDIWTQRADDTTECGKVPIEGDYNWCNEIPSMPIQEGDMICY